jgi:hypothetical protein
VWYYYGIPRSSYYYHVKHRDSQGVARRERLQVNLINRVKMSDIMNNARLMKELGLVGTQPRKNRYKITGDESKMAPNLL